MAVKIYDSSAGAFKDAPTPQIYDASSQAYRDSTGLVYDTSKGAWDERWGSVKIVPFATGTDEEINAMLAAYYNGKINLADYWKVGDKRSMPLSAMPATGVRESHRAQTVRYVVGDFEHDDLVTPINGHNKAAVTLLQVDCLMDAECETGTKYGKYNTENGYMNSEGTNVGGWKSCARRKWCNEIYYNALPTIWQSMVKAVNKKVSVGYKRSTIETVQDKIFLAAEVEIFGFSSFSCNGEGTRYQYYQNNANNIEKKPLWDDDSSYSSLYFQRSPSVQNNTNFCVVSKRNSLDDTIAYSSCCIAPCLCI